MDFLKKETTRRRNPALSPIEIDSNNNNFDYSQESDIWNEQQHEKLGQIVLRMKKMKEEKRAKDLVGSLPSRMLKSFNKNKFDLLNDKSFFYDENNYLQMVMKAEEKIKSQSTSKQDIQSPFENKKGIIEKNTIHKNNNNNKIIEITLDCNTNNMNNSITNTFNNNNGLHNQKGSSDNMNFKDEYQKHQVRQSMNQTIQDSNTIESGKTILNDLPTSKNMNQILIKQKWKTSFQNSFSRTTKLLVKKCEILLDNIPILHPSSPAKFTWDFFNIMAIMLSMFYIPIIVIFDFAFSALVPKFVIFAVPNILFIDIIVNLNTGYFEKGQVVKSRISIGKMYAQKNLLTDIISVLPFIFCLYDDSVFHSGNEDTESINYRQSFASHRAFNILKILFFLKTRAFSQILKRIEERFTLSHGIGNVLSLVKLLGTIVMINHLFACLWVYTAHLEHEADYQSTWMIGANVKDGSWGEQYLTAYYFTTVTMITVGYGDILPKSKIEMGLCVITMMLACCVFGYTLNEVGAIFSSFFEVDNEIRNKISTIQRFMSNKGINKKLQFQIREYLEYYWRESAEMNQEQEQLIIGQLSESLKSKLLFEANKIVLKDSPIFKGNFSKLVIEQTVPLINELKYSPESLICTRNVQDDQSIYFIENGSVDVILDIKVKNPQPIITLKKGDCFGSYSFFTGLPRKQNVRSREFTTVLKIKRSDFISLIQNYFEDHETFCAIRDEINYLNDFTKVDLKCKACSSSRHPLQDCQYLHYVPNKQKVIKIYNERTEYQNSIRESFQRRYPPDMISPYRNSRAIQEIVIEKVQQFHEDYESELELSEENEYSDSYYGIGSQFNEADPQTQTQAEEQELQSASSLGNNFWNAIKQNKSKQLESTCTPNTIEVIEEADEGDTIIENNQNESKETSKNKNSALQKFIKLSTDKKKNVQPPSLLDSQNEVPSTQQSSNLIPTPANNSEHPKSFAQAIAGLKQQSRGLDGGSNFPIIKNGKNEQSGRRPSSLNILAHLQNRSISREQCKGEDSFDNLDKLAKNKRNILKGATRRILNAQRIYEYGVLPVEKKISRLFLGQGIDDSYMSNALKQRSRILHILIQQFNLKRQKQFIKRGTSDTFSINPLQLKNPILNQKNEQNNLEGVISQLQQLLTKSMQNNIQLETMTINNKNSDEVSSHDIFFHFDKMKNFVKYNPRFNYGSIISRLNQILEVSKKQNKIKKSSILNDRTSKIKGTFINKQSMKGIEIPLEQKKMSKFSHGINSKQQSQEISTSQIPMANSFEKPNSIETSHTKDFTIKGDHNQTQGNESLNLLKGISGQPLNVCSPNSTFRDLTENNNKIQAIPHLVDDEKFNFNFIEPQYSKYEIGIIDEDGQGPSLNSMPHFLNRRETHLGSRVLNDQ